MKDPQMVAQNWAQNLAAATNKIKAGVMGTQKNPMQRAVAQQSYMVTRWNAAVNSGLWAQRTSAVSMSDWQNRMVTVGVQRIAQGAQAAQPKVAAFQQQWLPLMDQISAQVQAMPRGGVENAVARMRAVIEFNMSKKGQVRTH